MSLQDTIEQLQAELAAAKTENEQIAKQLKEHGEALNVLRDLRKLYYSSADMWAEPVASCAQLLIQQAEKGLRIAYLRRTKECIAQLQAELDTAKKQILDYEQIEAAVCPEDVGIKEYVASLQAENERLLAAVRLALVLADVESIKEVLEPWSKP